MTENKDTEKGLSDFVPFKNLFNEWLAKDTSRKVKAALRAKHAAGQRSFTYAPLGYIRHPEIKNALAIDEETKWIIEKIFDLAVHGAGAAKITKALIAEKIPTAGYLNYKRYGTFANIYAGALEEKSYAWTISRVKSILRDETYIGNSVHNKQNSTKSGVFTLSTFRRYTFSALFAILSPSKSQEAEHGPGKDRRLYRAAAEGAGADPGRAGGKTRRHGQGGIQMGDGPRPARRGAL